MLYKLDFNFTLKVIISAIFILTFNVHAQNEFPSKILQENPEIASGYELKPLVKATKQMVVSANPYATKVGLKVLRNGGSAVDAAIAMQMVLNIVEPQSSGIGGGGFLMFYANEFVQKKLKQKFKKLTAVNINFSNSGSEVIFNNE